MAEENEIITSENAEAAPVVDKEEIKEEIKEEVKDEVKDEVSDSDNDGGGNDFDPSSFTDAPVKAEKKEDGANEEVTDEKKDEDEVKAEDDDDGITWAGYDEEEDGSEETVVTDEEKPVVEENIVESKEEPQTVSTEAFTQVANELGLKFENIDEMKEHLQMLENENNELRKHSGSGATNAAIKKLQDLKSKSNEDLVKLSLEKDGFEGEELQDAVDKYIDNGMIDIEAKKIRNTIDKAIVTEQNKETQTTVESDAKQQEEYDKSVKQLGEHISKAETMFGFAMAKDEVSLEKVRKGHFNYIKSGKFMDDVFKDDQSLTEAAWFVKNKDTIIKAISNKSLQQGKQAILDDISEPEVIKTQRFKDPKGSSEFDPKAFTYGQVKEK